MRNLNNKLKEFAITHHRELFENNEEQVKTSLVLPLLRIIGWDDSNPLEVSFEARTSDGGRIDILLRGENNSKFLIEVKNLSKNLKDYIDQFGRYAFNRGIPYGALTNGKQWIFLESFKENVPIERRIIAEIDLCEDNLLKIYAVLSCLTKGRIANFEKCIEANFKEIYNSIENFIQKLFRNFKCSDYYCNILLNLCKEHILTLKKNLNYFSEEGTINKLFKNVPVKTFNSSNTYKVKIGNNTLECSTRRKLIEKLIEESFNNRWFKVEDLPLEMITTKSSLTIVSLNPIQKGRTVEKLINGQKVYINIGRNGPEQQQIIRFLLEKIKEKTGINYEVIKI